MSFKHKSQNNLNCDVCKINISTEAEYALHEFSKKHCDNLLKLAKNKPIVSKQKTEKVEIPTVNKDQPKVNIIRTTGNFAKYGYFVHGEVYDTNGESKEFNTEYDPYLQKYAKNPFNDQTLSCGVQRDESHSVAAANVTSFKRKKKKKIRKCEICNLTFQTVPEYEAHLRSPQHSWNLKLSGMGVSAHFVKASSDLHTIEMNEDSTSKEVDGMSVKTDNIGTDDSRQIFPTLYCDICELFLNSEQQYNVHVNGKCHNDNVQRKAVVRAKKHQLESVCPNQLYCFSCQVALNNLQQYREHKLGKKHRMKCRRLMREGITIPPEERVPSWEVPRVDPKKPIVYPEMYEKFLNETQRKGTLSDGNDCEVNDKNSPGNYYCQICTVSFSNFSNYEIHINSEEHQRLISDASQKFEGIDCSPRLIFSGFKNNSSQEREIGEETSRINSIEESHNNEQMNQLNIIGFNEIFKCSVCCVNFMGEAEYEFHLTIEDHARKILQLKSNGVNNEEILDKLLKDRSVVKIDNLGRYTCYICLITTGGILEFRQHVSSVVHKQMEEEFQKKREIELNSVIDPDESGNFICKLCQENFTSLTDYNYHLHTAKHREGLKVEKARKLKIKNRLLLQQRRVKQKYFISGLKRKDFGGWRRNYEKIPSLKTKISEINPSINHKDITSNPKLVEEKLDSSQEDSSNKKIFEEKRPESIECIKHKRQNMEMSEPYKTVKPLMLVNNRLPFLPQPPPLMSKNVWNPYHPQHFRPNFFSRLPNKPWSQYSDNNYRRASIFRSSRKSYSPCYY